MMRAMLLDAPGRALRLAEVAQPVPGAGQVLVRVKACAVCRTDLHVVDGDLARPEAAAGPRPRDRRRGRGRAAPGDARSARASASASRGSATPAASAPTAGSGRENLCDAPRFTGYTHRRRLRRARRGRRRVLLSAAGRLRRRAAAPLLCAGLIGYRSLRMAGDARRARHLRLRRRRAHRGPGGAARGPGGLRLHPPRRRRGARRFARALGAVWAGDFRRAAARSRWTRRSSSPPSARWCRRPCAPCARAARRLRRHPHERHPELPLPPAVGGARGPLGGEPDPPRCGRVPRSGRPGAASGPR